MKYTIGVFFQTFDGMEAIWADFFFPFLFFFQISISSYDTKGGERACFTVVTLRWSVGAIWVCKRRRRKRFLRTERTNNGVGGVFSFFFPLSPHSRSHATNPLQYLPICVFFFRVSFSSPPPPVHAYVFTLFFLIVFFFPS